MPYRRHRWDPICDLPTGLVRPVRVDPTGAAGPTPGQARGKKWRRLGHGWVVPAGTPYLPEQRIVEAATFLPAGGAVTGWASLRMLRGNFFDGLLPDGRTPLPVPLVTGPYRRRRQRAGIAWLQDRLAPGEVVIRGGVPCAIGERAVFDAMRRPRNPARFGSPRDRDDVCESAVAMGMAAAAEITSISRVRTYFDAHACRPGTSLVGKALTLADESSRSPQEARVLFEWETGAGLPRPRTNCAVFDRDTWRLLGIADLLDEEAGLVGEVDGGEHAGAVRRSKDAARDGDFRDHDLEVFRVTGADIPHPARVRDRILAARRRARFLPPEARTWTTELPPWRDPGPTLDEILDHRDR